MSNRLRVLAAVVAVHDHLRTLAKQGLIVRPDRFAAEYLPAKARES